MARKKSYKKRDFMEAKPGLKDLGPLQLLPGKWVGKGTGWNMIALPFNGAPTGFHYRVLMNQYDEELDFAFVDSGVPNRGLLRPDIDPTEFDQRVVTLDYQQKIKQIAAEDFPDSGLAGAAGLPIHHEPGLWLYMTNLRTKDINVDTSVELDVARLATIPHGNSVLAVGTSEKVKGMPEIPKINGLPIGRFEDLDSGDYDFKTDDYLEPYKHFIDTPFVGTVPPAVLGFPGFSPKDMNAILRFANEDVKIARTTVLSVDSRRVDAGVVNLPFAAREAEPVSMRSTFWIQELKEKYKGKPKLRLQYSQVVMLNFFRPREDELPGRATWPHVSINTLERVYEEDSSYERSRKSDMPKSPIMPD